MHVMWVVRGQQLHRQAPHKFDVVYNLQREEWGVGAWLRLFVCVYLCVHVCVCMFVCLCVRIVFINRAYIDHNDICARG